MSLLILAALAYLLGSIPAGYILVRLQRGTDIREEGSGNIGATNVMRSAGRVAGIATLLLDGGKGILAVLTARWAVSAGWIDPGLEGLAMAIAFLAVVAGHVFPVTLGFRGGKGVACAAGASLLVAPMPSLVALAGLAVTIAATRWVSLGSLVFAALFPLGVLLREGAWPSFPFLAVASLLVILRHSSNISRLAAGTEPRLGSR